MRLSTMTLHRQLLRLCKGIVKAWEQWILAMEQEEQLEQQENGRNKETVPH